MNCGKLELVQKETLTARNWKMKALEWIGLLIIGQYMIDSQTRLTPCKSDNKRIVKTRLKMLFSLKMTSHSGMDDTIFDHSV